MSFVGYQDYKETGAEWLGLIPSHWNAEPCRSIFTERNEKNDPLINENYLSLMANVGIILYEEKGDVGNKKPEDLRKCKQIYPGDLVINSMNYGIGSYGLSKYRGVSSPVYIVLKPKLEKIEERYAFRILENKKFQQYAQSFGNGILEHRASIGWDILKTIKVPLPPIAEQKSILQFLDHEITKIDVLRSEQQKLIELLKEKRQAIITNTISKGLDPSVKMKNSGVDWLGEVPEHWSVTPFKWVSKCKSGDGIAHLNISSDKDDEHPFSVIGGNGVMGYSDKVNVAQPVLAIGRVGALCGNIHEINEHVWISDNALVVEIQSEVLDLDYTAMVLRSRNLNEIATRTAQPLITGTQVREQRIPIPSIVEQKAIVQFIKEKINEFDGLITKSHEAIDLLQERRISLISSAVTGQIDVRDYKIKEAA